jgi:glycerophosphoryl diester phosphodiesterase
MRATESLAVRPATRLPRPVVIGHRGAPAYRPEHTAAGYELAIDLGAELIEPDVVVSRDGVLVVRHESELSWSTDVGSRPEFAHRRTTKVVGDESATGWFAEDFTLAELRTLRAVERMPEIRPLNTAYDGRFGILTLAEVIDLARARSTGARQIRVLAELKHPGWSAEQGLPMAELVSEELRRLGATGGRSWAAPTSSHRRTARSWPCSPGRSGRRTRSFPSTCASETSPRTWATRSPRPVSCSHWVSTA